MFVDIHDKYIELTLITYENTQKVNQDIFFDLTVSSFCVNPLGRFEKFMKICKKKGKGVSKGGPH